MFFPKPVISFRSARKSISYLVKAKLYPTQRTAEPFKCTKKPGELYENVNITDNFTSSVIQNTYKVNHKLHCNDKCLIYLLTCKQCLKKYVGKTTYVFCKARTFLIGKSCMQQHLFERFQSPGRTGFIENVCLTFTDKTDPFIPTNVKIPGDKH